VSALGANAQAVAKFGRVDVVVNNAGYSDLSSFEDTTIDSFRTQVESNFYGVVNVSKAVVPIQWLQSGPSAGRPHAASGRCLPPSQLVSRR
jgi:NAD(P)-dependent dehydrogenase (short-subunit alcohol dehydrogenase family)